MAKSGKKQGGKSKAKVSSAPKKSKKPASFSKTATAKTKKQKTEKAANFEEFETLKLVDAKKLDSKIVIRDVAVEKPIKSPAVVTDCVKPKATPQPKVEPKVEPVKQTAPKISAKEIKEYEIEKAIKNATKLPDASNRREKKKAFGEFGWSRVVLATLCVTTAVFSLVWLANQISSNLSLQGAVATSGIDAKYPSYVPRGYELSDVTSMEGKVTMHYKSGDDEFGITEESSSWDSEGLLGNFIKPTYGDNYTVVREQGLTLYMGGDWEAWVNGGMFYRLEIVSGSLTKKQMKTIATSL